MKRSVTVLALALASTAVVACSSSPAAPTQNAPTSPASATQAVTAQPAPTAAPFPQATAAPQQPDPNETSATTPELPPNGAGEAITGRLPNGVSDALARHLLLLLLQASRDLEESGGVLQIPSYVPAGFELLEVERAPGHVRLRYGIPGEMIYFDFTQRMASELGEVTAAGPEDVAIRPVADFRTGGGLPSSVGLVEYAGFQTEFTHNGTRIEVYAEAHRCLSAECRARLAWCPANSCPEFSEPIARAIITSLQPVIGGFLPPNGAGEAITRNLLPDLLEASRQLEELGGALQVPSYIPGGLELLEVERGRREFRLRYGIPDELIYIDFTQRLPNEAETTAAGSGDVSILPVGDFRSGGGLPDSGVLIEFAGFRTQFTQDRTRINVTAGSHRCLSSECRDRLAWCTANSCPEFSEVIARAIITSLQPVIGGFLPANGAASSIANGFENAIGQIKTRFADEGSALYLPTYLPEGMFLTSTNSGVDDAVKLFFRDRTGSRWFYIEQGLPPLNRHSTRLDNIGTDDEPIFFDSFPAGHQASRDGVTFLDEIEEDGAFNLLFERDGMSFKIQGGNGTCISGNCAKWSRTLFAAIVNSLQPDGQDPASP